MFPRRNPNKQSSVASLVLLLVLLWLLTIPLTPDSSMAHKVEVSGTVGGTSHIEPNDNPRAGTPSFTWFALAQKGGTLIPLKNCNCQLAVYAEPHAANAPAIQQLPLKAVSAEGYRDIPGADITFPQVGAYTLVIRGKAIAPATFQPFELRFPVMVVAGQPSVSPTPAASPEPTTPASTALPTEAKPTVTKPFTSLVWVLVLSIGLVALTLWFIRRQNVREKK